jgi:hypothetical protein
MLWRPDVRQFFHDHKRIGREDAASPATYRVQRAAELD